MNDTDSYEYDPSAYVNFTAPDWETPPQPLTPVLGVSLVLYFLVFLLGVPGNAAVVWVTGCGMKRTVNTVWFLNLALADLLCCLALPFLAVPAAHHNRWDLGDFACKLLPSLTILNMFASVLLLTAISADRCALVTQPVWCQNHRTPLLAWGLCGAVWLLALMLTLPTFIFRTTRAEPFSDKVTCGVDYGQMAGYATEVSVAAFRFATGFLVPFVVIATCYGRVLARLHSSRFHRSRKTMRVVLVVLTSFFVCWLPYHVVGLILATHSPSSSLYKGASTSDPLIVGLAYVNSCINPIIYVIMGQDFKDRFQRSLKTILRNVLSEDSLHSTGDSRTKTKSTLETKSMGGAHSTDM
ncbi:C5a anaphylatoxin chemotactic receptor 1-like isoform X2 [Carettochelys insculpta]